MSTKTFITPKITKGIQALACTPLYIILTVMSKCILPLKYIVKMYSTS